MPNPVLSDEQWNEVEKAAIAGVPYNDLSERFGVEANAIRQRAFWKKWAVPSRIQKLRDEYALEKGDKPDESSGDLTRSNKEAVSTEIIAESLVKYGDETAILVAKGAHAMLKKTFDPENPLLDPPKNWKEAGTAMNMVWKATGRDKPQQVVSLNLWSSPSSIQGQGPVREVETWTDEEE